MLGKLSHYLSNCFRLAQNPRSFNEQMEFFDYALQKEQLYFDCARRGALEIFKEFMTPQKIDEIRVEIRENRLTQQNLRTLGDLIEMISHGNSKERKEEDRYLIIGAIKRNDVELVHLIANEIYKPGSEKDNPVYAKKLEDIAYHRTRPLLELVK